jgi:hypothetical protein
MGDLVNLNKYRKAKQRLDDHRQATINREKFGRSKAETERDRRERRLDDKTLDDRKIEPDSSDDKLR